MKTLKYLAAAALTLLAVSCNKEQVTEVPDGQTVDVTFTAALPGEMATKAIGDGQTAKTLYVSVYENDDAKTKLDLDKTATFTDLKTQVTFSLVKGKTYNFVFWAQAAEGVPYDVTDLKNIKISYEGAEANDEKRDAFYATRKELKVNGALTETIKLYRPFAQVNFGTADYDAAVAAGVKPVKSVFTATDVATVFDTFEAEGKEAKDVVTFTESALPGETLVTKAGDYKWMTMNYILPMGKQDAKHISNVTAEFIPETGITVKASSPQTPVQNNYRTNILGNLLTSQVIFNIEIVPIFNEPDNDIDLVNIKNVESLKALFATGGEAILTEDLVLDKTVAVETGKEVVLDLNGKTINNTTDIWNTAANDWSLLSVRGGSLTIKGAGTLQAKENDCFAVDVMDGGKVVIEDGTYVGNVHAVYVFEGSVEIKGGKYSIQQPSGLPSPYGYVLNCYDANCKNGTAKIMVSGGEFVKFNPADCAAEGAHTNFLADGYMSVEAEEGVWTVVRGTKPVVMTTAELRATLTAFTSAGSGDNVIEIGKDIVLKEGETWVPAKVDGYHGAGVVTVLGNGHKISGLNAPLFAGGFAGNSGIIVKDLTLDGVKINDATSNLGIGAFVCDVDSMPTIELDNCHLTNSEIISTGGARVGGLIGWTSGYNNPNDGPVDTYIKITKCSVEGCTISAKGSVGGIIGHAGCNPATFHTITDCAVKNCVINSTDDGGWRVGVVVGTANVGELTITNVTESGNTVTQTGKTAPEHSNLYGRFVPGDTGKLVIDEVAQ
uniref:DUF6562 domain-containing protein n=1 Tax=Candidatus Cryptobacteroides bacterium TaxID=3085639 RepID=UPI003FF154AE